MDSREGGNDARGPSGGRRTDGLRADAARTVIPAFAGMTFGVPACVVRSGAQSGIGMSFVRLGTWYPRRTAGRAAISTYQRRTLGKSAKSISCHS